jgi:hypothetical protein
MGEFKPVFSINNYKIQINILYNIKEGDDTNISTDELDSNYYIIKKHTKLSKTHTTLTLLYLCIL